MARPKIPFVPRFWAKVQKTPDCWLWTAGTFSSGYGKFSINCGDVLAHRMSYEIAFGSIPDGLQVLHRCDVPQCVRPDHLFLGTSRDNMHDMIAKRRDIHFQGELSSQAVLTEQGVKEIRRLRDLPKSQRPTYDALANMFGVNRVTVYQAAKRRTWKHIA